MDPKVKIDHKLDCIGLFCPEPLFQTRTKIDELKIMSEIVRNYIDANKDKELEKLERLL